MQQRAEIVLLAAQGWQNRDIAAEVDLDRRQVALWRRRFLDGGVQAPIELHPRGFPLLRLSVYRQSSRAIESMMPLIDDTKHPRFGSLPSEKATCNFGMRERTHGH